MAEQLPTIKTFCEKCAELYRVGYKVKRMNFDVTTEKKKACERCGMTGGIHLAQYLVDSYANDNRSV